MQGLISEKNAFFYRLELINMYIENISKNNTLFESMCKYNDDEALNNRISYLKSLPNNIVNYKAIIISLYSAFENYIDDLLSAYLDYLVENLNILKNFPTEIHDKYKNKLGEYLTNSNKLWFSSELDEKIEIKKYILFLEGKYQGMGKDFIVSHSGNLKYKIVRQLFTELGIKNFNNIFDFEEVKDYFLKKYDENEFGKLKSKPDSLFKEFDQLVEERNKIAHSWESDERISIEIIQNSTIPLMKIFATGLLDLCINVLCTFIDDTYLKKIDLIECYNDSICCFNNSNIEFYKGENIIIEKSGLFFLANIESIEINHIKIERIDCNQSIDIGIKIDKKVNKNCKIINIIKGKKDE